MSARGIRSRSNRNAIKPEKRQRAALLDATTVTSAQLTSGLAGKVSTGGTLVDQSTLSGLAISNPPTQAEVQAIRDEIVTLFGTLRVHA